MGREVWFSSGAHWSAVAVALAGAMAFAPFVAVRAFARFPASYRGTPNLFARRSFQPQPRRSE